jgi:hypothetical protein
MANRWEVPSVRADHGKYRGGLLVGLRQDRDLKKNQSLMRVSSDLLQLIREKLQRRLKRILTADLNSVQPAIKCAFDFMQSNEIIAGILHDLDMRTPQAQSDADAVLTSNCPKIGPTEVAHAGICLWVLVRYVAVGQAPMAIGIGSRLGGATTAKGMPGIPGATGCGFLAQFGATYVEPLFDYIQEQLDDTRVVLGILSKYKHRCEWFCRADLFAACKVDTRKGEKTLVYDLYKYLHDQGVQFEIEPRCVSGRIDLISAQTGKDRLVADAKIFNPDRGQNVTYLVNGFRQIYEYAKDYNEPFGYLVIYKTCEQDLAISTPHREASVPFLTHNNKTIFLLVIDIFDYAETASKRGKLKAYEITPEQLIEAVQAAATTPGGSPDPDKNPA